MSALLSAGEVAGALQDLNRSLVAPWTLGDRALGKTFEFADFVSAFGFMSEVAVHAEQMDHHPDWCNSYGKVRVTLTTHAAGGLTGRDFSLAARMDECAERWSSGAV